MVEASDNQVTYVRNITDIDDKIIKRAQENGDHPRPDRSLHRRACMRTPTPSACCAPITSRGPPSS